MPPTAPCSARNGAGRAKFPRRGPGRFPNTNSLTDRCMADAAVLRICFAEGVSLISSFSSRVSMCAMTCLPWKVYPLCVDHRTSPGQCHDNRFALNLKASGFAPARSAKRGLSQGAPLLMSFFFPCCPRKSERQDAFLASCLSPVCCQSGIIH